MYSYDSLFVKNIFLPSEIRIMNLDGSDKPCVCRNALQTSLIREKIRRRISSTINCEIQNRLQNYNFFWTISNNLQKIRILYNAFNIKKGQETLTNTCAVVVLCFDYIHSFIVKFVLNQKRINTILNNFLYICNINACSKSTSVNDMQFLARCERKWHTIPIILQQIRFYQSNGIMHIWH